MRGPEAGPCLTAPGRWAAQAQSPRSCVCNNPRRGAFLHRLYFRERGREGGRERNARVKETHQSVASAPAPAGAGNDPQPRCVPSTGNRGKGKEALKHEHALEYLFLTFKSSTRQHRTFSVQENRRIFCYCWGEVNWRSEA